MNSVIPQKTETIKQVSVSPPSTKSQAQAVTKKEKQPLIPPAIDSHPVVKQEPQLAQQPQPENTPAVSQAINPASLKTEMLRQKAINTDKYQKVINVSDSYILQFFNENCIDAEFFIRRAIDQHIAQKNANLIANPELTRTMQNELLKYKTEYDIMMKNKNDCVLQMRELLRQMDALQLKYFTAYMEKNLNITKESFVCPNCNLMRFQTKKGVSIHLKKCTAKISANHEDEDEEEDEEV